MHNLRTYARPPYTVAVIHGGPGAAGEMAPVARALAPAWGVLEPLQTATSLRGQVKELAGILRAHGALPVTLIGYSWGAWLSYLVAAYRPALASKLVLVSSGPFAERYVGQLAEARQSRLSESERAEFDSALRTLEAPATQSKDAALARLGALAARADAYDALDEEPEEPGGVRVQGDLFRRVWQEAAELRRSGGLLALAPRICCPVVAIHGDYDPHPAAGVREPLSAALANFRFILLSRCGHTPWRERQARGAFYRALENELGRPTRS